MSEEPLFVVVLVLASAVGSGLMAGLFFAFSTAVMAGLGRIPDAQGAAAMQSINIRIVNPVFLSAFVGTAVVSLAVAIIAVVSWGEPGTMAAVVGGVAYLIGSIVLTGVVNIPLNNSLAVVDPSSEEGAALWRRYLVRWTAWNHARTLACLVACVAFILALVAD